MQQLKLNEETSDAPERERNFFRRQFQKESTGAQRKFDWIFGVVLPVACFFFDPIVFKAESFGPALFGAYKPFAYLLSFASVMAMAAWLIWGTKLKWLNAFLAGFFLTGGIVSLVVGIVLAPFSLLGLIFLIGVLGFTPLFSALVFLRNSLRAFHAAKPFLEKAVLVNSFALTAILSVVIPAVANVQIKKVVDEMKKGDVATIKAKAQTLKYVAPIVNFDFLAQRYHHFAVRQEAEEMKTIAEVYKQLTGDNLEEKVRRLKD